MYHQYRKESNDKVRNASVSTNSKTKSFHFPDQVESKSLDEKTLLKIWSKALAKISSKESSCG